MDINQAGIIVLLRNPIPNCLKLPSSLNIIAGLILINKK